MSQQVPLNVEMAVWKSTQVPNLIEGQEALVTIKAYLKAGRIVRVVRYDDTVYCDLGLDGEGNVITIPPLTTLLE